MSAAKVKVAVVPGSVVYVEGRGHVEGQVLEVTAADAKALEAAGVARRAA